MERSGSMVVIGSKNHPSVAQPELSRSIRGTAEAVPFQSRLKVTYLPREVGGIDHAQARVHKPYPALEADPLTATLNPFALLDRPAESGAGSLAWVGFLVLVWLDQVGKTGRSRLNAAYLFFVPECGFKHYLKCSTRTRRLRGCTTQPL